MNKKQLIILGTIAVSTVVLMIFLTWLGFTLHQPANSGPNGVTYTDTTSGQNLTAFPETSNQHGDNDSGPPPNDQVTITGLDDFFAGIGQQQATDILNALTAFIHARTGTAAGAKAAVLNGQVNHTSSNPDVYKFTLVLQQSDAHYSVTITMPTTLTTPDVTFGGATQ